jgi:hypothetical protein
MPSLPHEGLIELVRKRPTVIADLLAGPLKVDVPEFRRAHLLSSDLPEVTPTEYRADGVIGFFDESEGGNPAFAVVFEVQRRCDSQKRLSWPVYVATTHARHDCPTALLVWCETRAVARWAAEPISTGDPGLVLTPVALGPDQVPVIPEGPVARQFPEMMVLSAAAHQNGPHAEVVLRGLASVLDLFDPEDAQTYTHMVVALASLPTRKLLEKIMTATNAPFSEYAQFVFPETFAKGEAKGKAKGKAESVLTVLDARGIAISDDARERITSCTDVEQLDAWIRHAATASRIEELFG